jgi:hypothetical protein
VYKKNTAVTGFGVTLRNKLDGSAVTTGTLTVYYTGDGGSQGTIAGAATHKGNGQWTFDISQSEMNYNVIALTFSHTSIATFGITIRTVDPTVAVAGANVVSINSVATSSVTTVNANVGTTQPHNFTGTGASATVKTDMVNIAGSAVSTSTAQLGVNVVNFGGSAGTFASGRPEVNTTHAAGTAWGSGAITAGAIASNAITAAKIATDAIGAAQIAADAVAEIQAGLSTYAGGDTSGTTTLLSRLTSTRAGLLDNLDAAVSTRSTYAGGDTSGTTTLLSRLTSTRAGYLDNIASAAPSAGSIADAVWDELLIDHIIVGSAGEALAAAQSGGAPSASDNAAAVWASVSRTLTADPAAGVLYDTGTTTGTPTTTSIQGAGGTLSTTNGVYVNAFIRLTSGPLAGETREITGYVGATKTFTTDPFTAPPASGVTFVVIGRNEP